MDIRTLAIEKLAYSYDPAGSIGSSRTLHGNRDEHLQARGHSQEENAGPPQKTSKKKAWKKKVAMGAGAYALYRGAHALSDGRLRDARKLHASELKMHADKPRWFSMDRGKRKARALQRVRDARKTTKDLPGSKAFGLLPKTSLKTKALHRKRLYREAGKASKRVAGK